MFVTHLFGQGLRTRCAGSDAASEDTLSECMFSVRCFIHCYGMNVCVPLKFICHNPNPNVML